MAKHAVLDGFLEINSNDVSAFVQSCALTIEKDAVDSTTWGESDRTYVVGLGTATLSITFAQDYTNATGLEAIMTGIVGTQVAFSIRPFSTAVGVDNPQYDGTILITNETFMDSSIGELNSYSVSFPAFTLTRTTA